MSKCIKRLICFVLLLALAVPAELCFANAMGPGSNLILIFDASGSMWGQIDGTAKISIAKNAMEAIVKDLPEDINVGLVAYGHRRKGDCDDLETLITLGKIDKQAFREKVKAINPKGKTPMVRSIRLTAESIKHLEDETTILLVSDGKETCDPEPCAFVAELKSLGIKFVMHVVGFDVGGEIEEELKCMATAGGGEYFPASDAGNLKEALDTVVKKAVDKNLKVSALLNGESLVVKVVVMDPQTGEELKEDQSTKERPAAFGLEPGVYDVKVIDAWVQESNPHKMFKAVEVNDTEVREVVAKFGAGRLEISPIKEGKLIEAAVELSDSNGEHYRDDSTLTEPAAFDLEEGTYKVSVRDAWGSEAVIELGEIAIAPGDVIKKEVVFESGFLEVYPKKKGKLFYSAVVLIDGKDEETREDSTETEPAKFEMLPGKYTLQIHDTWGSNTVQELGEVEILPGKVVKKEAVFETGVLEIFTRKQGKLFYAAVEITTPQGETVRNDSTETEPAKFEVLPGIYSVEIRDDWGDKTKRTFQVEIKAGDALKHNVDWETP